MTDRVKILLYVKANEKNKLSIKTIKCYECVIRDYSLLWRLRLGCAILQQLTGALALHSAG